MPGQDQGAGSNVVTDAGSTAARPAAAIPPALVPGFVGGAIALTSVVPATGEEPATLLARGLDATPTPTP